MKEKNRDRILEKLEEMRRYVDELAVMLPEKTEFLHDTVKRRACEKTIELAIESLMTTAALVVSAERLGLPESEENLIDLLVTHDILPKDAGERAKDMKGLRNILIHRYGKVDDERVYASLTEELGDFETFETHIKNHLKRADT